MTEIQTVKSWDQLPPVVTNQGEAFSTRVLERKYRTMKEALELIANAGMDAGQCQDTALNALFVERK